MSRSNTEIEKNPAGKFFQWSGSQGKFKYFDKSKGDKGENIFVHLPFKFLVLDTLSTIKGFSDSAQSGFWSNEVRDLSKDVLTVRTKKGVSFTGIYKDVVGDKNCTGSKYSQSVYIAYLENGKLELGNIQMMGSALGSWIDFQKKHKIYKGEVEVVGTTQGKKGATTYQIPTFNMNYDVTPEVEERAKELDLELQGYLTTYLKLAQKDPNLEVNIPEEDITN